MKRRFVIFVDSISSTNEEAFIEYMKDRDCSWWHWIANCWLVVDYSGKVSSKDLRDVIMRNSPLANSLVLEVPKGGSWHGLGPATKERRNMFRWLAEIWSDE